LHPKIGVVELAPALLTSATQGHHQCLLRIHPFRRKKGPDVRSKPDAMDSRMAERDEETGEVYLDPLVLIEPEVDK
jgi:hypothetical protein